MESARDLHRDLSKSSEALQSRVRLWAEDRLRKERAVVEESLERAAAQGGMVRALLDEAVKAVSKELEILRSEARARNVALEESLDERASDLEARLTEIDNGSAKKRRVSELTKETGARIGQVERRVRQVRRAFVPLCLLLVTGVEQLDQQSCPCILQRPSIGGMANASSDLSPRLPRYEAPRLPCTKRGRSNRVHPVEIPTYCTGEQDLLRNHLFPGEETRGAGFTRSLDGQVLLLYTK